MTTKEQIKHTGATFTPKGLADFLSQRIASHIKDGDVRVLDPACGEGELLVAMGKELSKLGTGFSLKGYDANLDYLNLTKERVLQFGSDKSELVNRNFLEEIDLRGSEDLFTTHKSQLNEIFDVVIANPPYVRTQILGAELAQHLAKKFNLKGRVDLYYPFLIAMTESLKKEGIMGVITSNRYLSTQSGESIRRYLSENFCIIELLDLGDTKLFDAAVLPAIFIGRKRKASTPSAAKFIKVYEELNGYKGQLMEANSIYDVLKSDKSGYFLVGSKKYKKTDGNLKYSISSGNIWEMLSTEESKWVSRIDSSAKNRVKDFFGVRVGIKTTADNVFISERWNDLGNDKPEEELLKELISQENIEPWRASENLNLKVLYPHCEKDGSKYTIDIEKFPKAKKYFLAHEAKLKARKYLIDAGRQWFEIWVPHNPELWNFPKLVFPDISPKPRFYFDQGGKIVNGNCYWIVARDEKDIDKLLLIEGVANSKLMTKYHDLVFNNKLYSGRRRYFTQYVEKYPLPDIDSSIATEIIALVNRLNEAEDKTGILQLENNLEIKVAEAFDVEPVLNLD